MKKLFFLILTLSCLNAFSISNDLMERIQLIEQCSQDVLEALDTGDRDLACSIIKDELKKPAKGLLALVEEETNNKEAINNAGRIRQHAIVLKVSCGHGISAKHIKEKIEDILDRLEEIEKSLQE